MADIPRSAREHYRTMRQIQLVVTAAGRRAWRAVDPEHIGESWTEALADLGPVVTSGQARAALSGSAYSAMSLAEQGVYIPPLDFVDPNAFAGYASDGRGLQGLLYAPATSAKSMIGAGATAAVALRSAAGTLDRILSTVVADAGRQAAGADVVQRPDVGYVRMLNPPSCSRCVVLAGRFYRWNAGFDRHPGDDCVHVASAAGSTAAARTEGLIDDPYEYFQGLDGAAQDRIFTKAGAQAIRDGADISQVVNARRGMTPNGHFTVEGTSRRGHAAQGLKRGQRRLTPEGIYENAERFGGRTEAERREYALRELRTHGYILPEGQVAGGALRGQREGFGALGRGGTRRAASDAVLEARRTGARDPRNRYTMTEAERRLYDAARRYEVALSGVSPYTSPGFGQTPDPYGLGLNRGGGTARRPVTAVELATAEQDYRFQLAAWGSRPIPWAR